ncbi:MAG: HAD family hydrolase [Nanoarchaeota archaeon]|nr:HAD family hydrolase [Nanoarchaeota archaeon]MBU1643884.1 HAD family hydrolase [Nanoarchaeota archaeon]MBU1977205.1 HAD family hydrolase [Nanoarchaeota archaeon]
MVKAILFDFWGTLVENGVWSPIKQVKDILGIRIPFSEYVVRMEKAMMTTKFESLKEAFKSLCQEFQIECSEEKLEQLIGLWNKSWMLARPYEEVAEELIKLKKDYQIILVSNTDCFSVNRVMEKFNLRGLFDKTYLSYEINLIKTDEKFLMMVLKDLKLKVEDCVLVGDSIQSDIMAAKALGMKAVLIDRKNTREYHPKIKNLKELENVL